jgi:Spy/CpxP family protein refolding chaperone
MREGREEGPMEFFARSEAMMARMVVNPGMAEKLGISSNQAATLREKLIEIKKKQIDLRAAIEKQGLEQAQLLSATPIDEQAVMAAVEKAGQMKTQMAKQELEAVLLLRKTLTPEQIAKAREMMREHMKQRWQAEGQGPGREMRGGPQGERGMHERRGGKPGNPDLLT